MAQQYLNVGAAAGDRSGDTLRVAGNKINSNFSELYNAVVYSLPTASTGTLGGVKVDGSTITISNGVITATGTNVNALNLSGTRLSPSIITSNLTSVGTLANLTVTNPITASITGNAASVSNGVYTTNFYANPSWITSLSYTKLTDVPASTLPIASASVLGGVRVDGYTITINPVTGIISASTSYTLPTASTSVLGGVKVDGNSILINNGVISANVPIAGPITLGLVRVDNTSIVVNGSGVLSSTYTYSLPTASTGVLGGVKVDGSTVIINGSGVISAPYTYTLPTATTSTLGGVRVDGTTITATAGVISSNYTLPTSSTSVLGGVKVDGTTITINNGIITAAGGGGGGSGTVNSGSATSLAYYPSTGTVVDDINNVTWTTGTNTLTVTGTVSATTLSGTLNASNLTGTVPVTSLPTATPSALGAIRVDGTTITISSGIVSVGSVPFANITGAPSLYTNAYIGTTNILFNRTSGQQVLTGVSIDGNAASVNNGVYTNGNYADPAWITSLAYSKISGAPATYSLPIASTISLGGVKPDGSTITINGTTGVITAVGYTLPTASTNTLGGVKIDGTTITISNGIITASASNNYTLPTASTATLGGVKVDGSTITISGAGVISSSAAYSLPTASTSVLGGVKIDNSTITISNGVIAATPYSLPTASGSVLGGVKVDASSITITGGVISATQYSLPTASNITLGGVKVDGTLITITSGTLGIATASTTQSGVVKIDGSTITLNGSGQLTASGAGLNSRTTVSTTTASIAYQASATATVVAAKGYALYSVQATAGAWVTIYTSSSAQTSDSSRTITTDPTPGSGVIAETITTGAVSNTTYFTPAVMGFNADGTPSTNMYLKIYNNSGTTGAITVTITYLKLEA